MRKSLIAVLAIILCLSVTFAAAKYAAPAIPANKNCVILNKVAKFTMARDANNKIDVTEEGEYNYDNAWTFESLSATPSWLDGAGGVVYGPGMICYNEAGLPVAGKWSMTSKIADLANGTIVTLHAILVITKPDPTPVPEGQPPRPPLQDTANMSQPKDVPDRK